MPLRTRTIEKEYKLVDFYCMIYALTILLYSRALTAGNPFAVLVTIILYKWCECAVCSCVSGGNPRRLKRRPKCFVYVHENEQTVFERRFAMSRI